MKIAKYFWHLSDKEIRATKRILRNPEDSRFVQRMVEILSRCDRPREVFSFISKEKFVEVWPNIRRTWGKRGQALDFKEWWETVYERLLDKKRVGRKMLGEPLREIRMVGQTIRETRIRKGWSQVDLSKRTGIKQPDLSAIEAGKRNITLETLLKIFRVLGITNQCINI